MVCGDSETIETKEWRFGNWVRKHSRGIAIAGVFGISGLLVGYAIDNRQQKRAYRQDIIGILEKVVQQDPNQAKVLLDALKPKEEVKEEEKEIKKEAKEMTQDKYIHVLEEHRELRKGNDALTAERNALMQKYDALSKEQAPLQQKYNKTLEDLTAVSAQKAALEAKQKELVKQVADANEVAVKLTAENNKLNKNYISEIESKRLLEQQIQTLTTQLKDVNDLYVQYKEETTQLETKFTESTAELNKVLRDYTDLLRTNSVFLKQPTGLEKQELEYGLDGKYGLLSAQVYALRRAVNAEVGFLTGDLSDIDTRKKDICEIIHKNTSNYVESVVERWVKEENRFALVADADGDGIKDIMYLIGTAKLKKGKRDGSFAPAEKISNQFFNSTIEKYTDEGLGYKH